ncbi:uncharacterized protein [Montipora capricornis]|uniref:uncharacterized protein n=1 Tax=Montipora capricornis TaxID=246305 RepID=UPI0035F20822
MHAKYFLLDWETNGERCLEGMSISPQAQFYFHFYVFYRSKELPAKLLPQFRFLHVPNKTIIASFEKMDWKALSSKLIAKDPSVRIQEKRDIILVSTEPELVFNSLMQILNTEGVGYKTVATEELKFMDEFKSKCVKCRMVFRDKKELKRHEERFCGYFDGCLIQKKNRKVGFTSEGSEFEERIPDADKCGLCTANCLLTYCPHRSRKQDMKIVHKTTYVGKTHPCWSKHDTDEFTAHFFYGYDVLPCLARIGCARTFRTIQEQAHHHVTDHGCHKPYFCAVCHKMLKVKCFESENELLLHGKLEGHCEPEFSFA